MSRIKQPQKPAPKTRGYTPEDHEGKLYRVRDKDYGDGNPPKIWGENLGWDAANALKQRVLGSRKSRTARIEEMTTPLPGADPTLEAVRQAGLAAGRGAAQSANARHQQQMAQRKVAEMQAASAPKPKLTPTLGGKATGRHHAAVTPIKKPEPPKQDLDDTDVEAPEVEDETGDDDNSTELEQVNAAAEDDINEYELKGKELYEAYTALGVVPGTEVKIVPGKWENLAPKDQAAWSFEAAAEQGPHVDAIKKALEAGTATAAPDAPLPEQISAPALPAASTAGDTPAT